MIVYPLPRLLIVLGALLSLVIYTAHCRAEDISEGLHGVKAGMHGFFTATQEKASSAPVKDDNSEQRVQIHMISSNSIYQFAMTAAEEFGSVSKARNPIVEPVGTGMGFKQFCQKNSRKEIDVVFASRQIRPAELALCKENGINNIRALQIGYDGVVFVTHANNPIKNLDRAVLFKAMGRITPNQRGEWAINRYDEWSDIDHRLPRIPIEFYAPSINTSSSDSIAELILVHNCVHVCCQDISPPKRFAKCREFRDDRNYIVGNDDARLIIRKLQVNKAAIGIIAYNAYMENRDSVSAMAIDGVSPTPKNITSGKYNVVRPLWVYIKADNVKSVKGFDEFISFISSKEAIGAGGILVKKGLIPLK